MGWLILKLSAKRGVALDPPLESGLAIIYKRAAHRLVQHRLQVVEMT